MLVAALEPRPGARWLDVGAGAGGVALRAARAGAEATGVDIAGEAVTEARRAAAEAGLEVRFDVAAAEELPFPDASFDVVCSAFGVIFAGAPERAAAELGRVCAPGGSLGLTLMPPASRAAELWSLLERYGAGVTPHPASWAEPGRADELLGRWFQFAVSEHRSPPEPPSDPAEAWASATASFGPLRRLAATLEPARLDALRSEFLALQARHAGRPLRYVLVLGRRR